jgi:hypothetical protein
MTMAQRLRLDSLMAQRHNIEETGSGKIGLVDTTTNLKKRGKGMMRDGERPPGNLTTN